MNEPFNVRAVFVAATISNGLLGLAQYRPEFDGPRPRHVVRRALQGGFALSAGALACNYLAQGRVGAGVATAIFSAGALLLTSENPPGFAPEQHTTTASRR